MWQVKYFKTVKAQKNWIEKNWHKYRINLIFVNNGYAVEFKKLIKL